MMSNALKWISIKKILIKKFNTKNVKINKCKDRNMKMRGFISNDLEICQDYDSKQHSKAIGCCLLEKVINKNV